MIIEAHGIAQRWLNDLAFSAATWNLDAHMALISREVRVLGIPGGKVIDYTGWKKRRHNEFSKKLLHSLTYRLINILSHEADKVHFTVIETMKSSQGVVIQVDKIVSLKLEEDGQWRVVQERIDRVELK